jgi:hypothetical protein
MKWHQRNRSGVMKNNGMKENGSENNNNGG